MHETRGDRSSATVSVLLSRQFQTQSQSVCFAIAIAFAIFAASESFCFVPIQEAGVECERLQLLTCQLSGSTLRGLALRAND